MTVFMTQKIRTTNKNSSLIEVYVPAGYKKELRCLATTIGWCLGYVLLFKKMVSKLPQAV
jgi:hypothetical protein